MFEQINSQAIYHLHIKLFYNSCFIELSVKHVLFFSFNNSALVEWVY